MQKLCTVRVQTGHFISFSLLLLLHAKDNIYVLLFQTFLCTQWHSISICQQQSINKPYPELSAGSKSTYSNSGSHSSSTFFRLFCRKPEALRHSSLYVDTFIWNLLNACLKKQWNISSSVRSAFAINCLNQIGKICLFFLFIQTEFLLSAKAANFTGIGYRATERGVVTYLFAIWQKSLQTWKQLFVEIVIELLLVLLGWNNIRCVFSLLKEINLRIVLQICHWGTNILFRAKRCVPSDFCALRLWLQVLYLLCFATKTFFQNLNLKIHLIKLTRISFLAMPSNCVKFNQI